jgi:ABC-2 type transport system permease protein
MSFFKTLSKAFGKEIDAINSSKYLFGLTTWIPLVVYILIIMIFKQGVLRDMPIAVVDHDKTALSKKVAFNLDSSSSLHVKYRVNSLKEAGVLLKKSKIYAIIVIPDSFEKEVYNHIQPKIDVMLNAQYILIAKSLNSAISSTLLGFAAGIDVLNTLVSTESISGALGEAVPIQIQVTPFFNQFQNYFVFLVSAIIPAIWQIFIVIASIASIGIVFKNSQEQSWFEKNSSVSATLMGKMLPYTISFFIQGFAFVFYMYYYLPWHFEGSLLILSFAILLCVVAYQGIGLFLFSTGFDYARALSLGAVYTAPAFAFLGITFPRSDMSVFAKFWNDMLPVSHYMKIEIAQANYGADIVDMLPYLGAISLFLVIWPVAVLRIKKHMESV